MIKDGIEIEKNNNMIHFFGCSQKYGRNYLYSKDFTFGEWDFFKDNRSLKELHSFHDWGKNPRLDKTIDRVILMYRYMEKEQSEQGNSRYLAKAGRNRHVRRCKAAEEWER